MMPHNLKRFGLLAFLLLIASTALSQQPSNIPPEAQQIMRQTLAENGYLTEEMHSHFWQIVRSLGEEEDINTGMTFLKSNLQLTKTFQTATWESMLLSWESNELRRTDDLIMMMDNFEDFIVENNPFPQGTSNHSEFSAAFEAEYRNSMRSVEAFLTAAANRRSYVTTPNGGFPLSKDMIQRVLDNIDSSFSRIDRLFDPQWRD